MISRFVFSIALYLMTKPPLERWKVFLPQYANPETEDMRQEVCWTVITSEHFRDFHHVYPANISETTDQKETRHPEESIRNVSTNATTNYKEREVWIGKRMVHELVFPCFARSHDTEGVIKFFISQVYRAQSRFVFKMNDDKKLDIIALAEISPAIISLNEMFDSSESGAPFGNSFLDAVLDRVDESRAICDMTAAEKVRSCSLIMNNYIYRDEHKVRFIPSRNGNPQCEKRELKQGSRSKSAWSIPCVVFTAYNQHRQLYYLTNAARSPNYFISRNGYPEDLYQVLHF